MTTIQRFEDILAWQKAHELSNLVYEISDRTAWNRDWKLRGQIRDASDSIEANIAEGFNRRGDKEFRQALKQAKGSAGEVRSHAYRAKKLKYMSEEELKRIVELSTEAERLIQGFVNYLNRSISTNKPSP